MAPATETIDRRRTLRGPAADFLLYEGREALCEGGTRCGKSWGLLIKIDYTALTYPGSRQLVCRQTRKSMNESVIKDWRDDILWLGHPAIRSTSTKEHQDEYVYPNKSVVYFAGLENMRDTASPILSTKWDRIYVIQAEETTQNDWEILATRLSAFKAKYHQLVADCNPAAPSHWLNQRFSPEQCGADRRRFAFRHFDNPLFYNGIHPNGEWTKEGKEYMSILESTLTGVRRERFLHSKWVAAEGIILDTYDQRNNVRAGELEKDPGRGWLLHLDQVEQPIRIAYFTAGVDFGWHPDPGAMQLWAYDSPRWHPNIRRFRVAEVMKLRWQQEDWAEIAKHWWETYAVKYFSCDPHDPENISAFNLRLGRASHRQVPGIAVKCPPIGGGHRRSPILEPQIDLMREGFLNPKTKHSRTILVPNFPEGIDEELRRTGRPCTMEQEVESWVYAIDSGGRHSQKPDPKCDEHAIAAARYDETLNFVRGFGGAVDENANAKRGPFDDEWAQIKKEKERQRKKRR